MGNARQKCAYVAGAGGERHMIARAMEKVRSFGFRLFDWTKNPGWDDLTLADPVRDALADLEGVSEGVDGCLWWLSLEHSSGAPFEVGCAFAKGYPIVVVLEAGWDWSHLEKRIFAHLFPYAYTTHEAMILLRRCRRLPSSTPLPMLAAYRFMERLTLCPAVRK